MSDPRLAAHQIRRIAGSSGEAWWYEDRGGIWVYGQAQGCGVLGARITWVQLLRSAKRSYRKRKKAAK